MTIPVDIWLRGEDVATTESIGGIARAPRDWLDEDARLLLEGMLQAMHRLKHPNDDEHPVFLRGLSWIVNPFEEGGVVIAIEIAMGAAIAGPLDIGQPELERMITRVLAQPLPPTSDLVH